MIFVRNLYGAALALCESSQTYNGKYLPLKQIESHLKDKEYWAIYEKGKLIGGAYFNGDDFHIGMIKKGLGAKATRQLTAGRKVRAVVENTDERTQKLGTRLGFKFVSRDNKYTYMVKQ